MRLSIVVPCFNEEGNVARVVAEAADVGRRVASDLEIIVVDDGSTDDTARVLDRLTTSVPDLIVVRHDRNRGYGAAVRAGLERASMDLVFLTDGDGQFDLGELPRAVRLLEQHDVVAGYRRGRRDGWWRSFCGRAWTSLVNQVLGLRIRDVNCAFKLLPRSMFGTSDLRSDGAMISAEILAEAKRLRLDVGELPVTHRPRVHGRQTGTSPRVIATAWLELLRFVSRSREPTPTTTKPRVAPRGGV